MGVHIPVVIRHADGSLRALPWTKVHSFFVIREPMGGFSSSTRSCVGMPN